MNSNAYTNLSKLLMLNLLAYFRRLLNTIMINIIMIMTIIIVTVKVVEGHQEKDTIPTLKNS
jgi:hypothetical protein